MLRNKGRKSNFSFLKTEGTNPRFYYNDNKRVPKPGIPLFSSPVFGPPPKSLRNQNNQKQLFTWYEHSFTFTSSSPEEVSVVSVSRETKIFATQHSSESVSILPNPDV